MCARARAGWSRSARDGGARRASLGPLCCAANAALSGILVLWAPYEPGEQPRAAAQEMTSPGRSREGRVLCRLPLFLLFPLLPPPSFFSSSPSAGRAGPPPFPTFLLPLPLPCSRFPLSQMEPGTGPPNVSLLRRSIGTFSSYLDSLAFLGFAGVLSASARLTSHLTKMSFQPFMPIKCPSPNPLCKVRKREQC